MKGALLSLVMFLGVSLSASSQLLLNSGDSYNVRFSGLDLIRNSGIPACTNYSWVTLGLAPSTFNEGDALQIEVRTADGSLFGSGTVSYPMQPVKADFDRGDPLWVPGAGYNGEIRVTMLSGSAVLETVAINLQYAVICDPGEGIVRYTYGTVLAVPEPSVMSLGAVVVAVTGWRLRRGRVG
jgi:hypothetical protein